ncbi:MAG TPA: flippase, partial [Thermoplasmata archaeon]|nr:flippase [Thermoplasmata archaeon]
MIARKSALIIVTQLINGLLGYVALKFIALYMEPWEYGVVGFAYGFVALFSILGNLGFNAAHVKRVSEGKDLGRCIGTFALIKTFLAGLMASTVVLSIAVWKYVIGRGFESSLHEQAAYVMLVYFVLVNLTQSFSSTFRARREIVKAQMPLLIYTLVRVMTTIFVAFYGLGALALAYTYVLGEVFHFVLTLFFFRKYPVGKPSLKYFKSYVKFAIPMSIAGVSAIVMTNIDKVFIQLFWSATQVGEYFAVYNLSRFIILFSSAVNMLLLPTISSHHSKNELSKIKQITGKAERYLSMITFPTVIILITLAAPAIHILLSDKYLSALPVLQILPLFVLMEVLSGPYTQQLSGMNMPQFTRNRMLIMIITNVFLNLVLIPKDIQSLGLKLAGLGATGAAIATVASYATGLMYVRFVAWRTTGVRGEVAVVIHGFAAALTGVILYYVASIFFIARWFYLLGVSMMGMILYFSILFILKGFTKDDLYLFLDTLHIRKM